MKDIPGFEGRYAVANDGRVWSYPKRVTIPNNGYRLHDSRWLKQFYRGSGSQKYAIVELDGRDYAIHRLVAIVFIPNPDSLPEVNHIDGDRRNNNVTNLEWVTHKGNMQHAQRTGLNKQFYGERHGGHKLSTMEVEEIRAKKSQGYTLKQLSEEYHSSISNISYICRRETRIYG